MQLFLVRHGAVSASQKGKFYGGTEVALSQEGMAQAQAAGRWLSQFEIDAVYASPLSRAQYGAQQVLDFSRQPELAIQTREGFREIDRGRWVGLRFEELESQWPGDMAAHEADLENWNGHGGESLGTLRERVLKERNKLLEKHLGQVVVIVSHLFPTAAMLADGLGIHLSGYREMQVPTGSISRIIFGEKGVGSVEELGFQPPRASSTPS